MFITYTWSSLFFNLNILKNKILIQHSCLPRSLNSISGGRGCYPSAQLVRPVLPATVDTDAELSGGRQGESSTPRQSLSHVGRLAEASAADIVGLPADGRRRHTGGGVGLRLGTNLCDATHVHMRCTCGCPWHARVGLQAKCMTSSQSRPAQRRRVACDAACPGAIPQGTGGPQQVRLEASWRCLSHPLVTRPLCDLRRHVTWQSRPIPSQIIGNQGRVSGC